MNIRPGDKQPEHRNEVVARFREAAAARRSFQYSMQQIKGACGATPAEIDAFAKQIKERWSRG